MSFMTMAVTGTIEGVMFKAEISVKREAHQTKELSLGKEASR